MDENSSRCNKRAKKLSVKEKKKIMAEIVATYVVAVDRNGDARANVQPHTSPLPTMIVCVMSDQMSCTDHRHLIIIPAPL